ncbi:MAG: DNA primase [Salinicola sp.]|uniref:toprim domain-containing protein n=1 Tax=uncultured Salinicola sp. TaxID=1193542 RepID=UPI000C8A086C|nr:toprim domain-containing protein [uncultured Salinicola sp.]MAM59063.1 DNA primase [Salinicola sp.]
MSEVIAKIQRVSRASLAHAETLTREWLPQGSRQGSEWVARNVARGDRASGSFGVSLASGKWNDFADNSAHGGDLVSLYSYLNACRQVDAAMAIDRRLGLGVFRRGITPPVNDAAEAAAMVAYRQRLEDDAAEREHARQEAADRARSAWRAARPAPSTHPYLMNKGIPAYHLRQCRRGWLLVPLHAGGELVNLQWITPNGRKRFLKGGQVQGAYAVIGEIVPGGRVYVCEGWATGATLHRLTGDAAVCAMHAGNLRAVAEKLRQALNGSLDLVIAGDDDRQTAGNPGRQAANDAALAVGAMVLYPKWPEGCPDDLTDFNDLYRWHRARLDDASRDDQGQAGSTDMTGGDHE